MPVVVLSFYVALRSTGDLTRAQSHLQPKTWDRLLHPAVIPSNGNRTCMDGRDLQEFVKTAELFCLYF